MSPAPPVRDDIGLMEGYHSPQVEVDVRLNTNESPLPPPDGWVEALRDAVQTVAFNRYPDRDASGLREAIAAEHAVDPAQVLCANGSNEVLQSVLLAYGGAGRKAAVFEPTYALHSHIARLTGTEVVGAQRREDFALDLDRVASVLTSERPAVTFLCSPNNPTGLAETPDTVAAVLGDAPGLVVVDEAYGQFAPWSALSLVSTNDQLVVTRTFSKTWSMAGARLGYLVGPEKVISSVERVLLPYHLDAVKQLAGILALRFRPEMEARVALLAEERGRVAAALGDLPVESWPSDANFILFRPTHHDGGRIWQALLDRSVLVRDCSTWPSLDGCLRVTIGTPEENSRFLASLKECLA